MEVLEGIKMDKYEKHMEICLELSQIMRRKAIK